MPSKAITDLIDVAYSGAAQYIEKDPSGERECIPTGFVLDGNTVKVIVMPWHTEAEKDAYLALLRELCKEPSVTAYAVMSEAWVAALHQKDRMESMPWPSEAPNRQECLIITLQERGQEVLLVQAPIRRKGKRRCLGPYEIKQGFTNTYGRMLNLFEDLPRTN